ncbi:MAG: hypothetical protein K2Q22_10275, partial [Cytophagales bacterium]|nr:hypothetical protein [Cytophagales bacterium]
KSIIKLEEKFDVQVTVSNNQILGKLNKGFLDYISSNDFIAPQIKTSQKLYKDMLQQIYRELKSLDSLKRAINKSLIADKSKSLMFLSSPGDISTTVVELYEKQIKLEKSLIFENGFQTIQSFSPNVPDTNLRFNQLLILSNFIGFIIIVLILGLIDIGKKMS